ncbi:MAG: radical SAM protein [Actinobacteria bacterium]|nr:radical SAM protein [Actinomycetota bacterium]
MELPRRDRGDELLRPGELASIRKRLRNIAPKHDLTTVIVCAFDHRTRMPPATWSSVRMAPAGVRAIGSAMLDAGFDKTRIVLQQWNRHFRPSQMRLDGRVPDLFMVSSMQIHTAQCQYLIRDACRIDPAHRPLIIAGGPKTIYEPWDVFSTDPAAPWAADVAVTGEEYVLLHLLEVLLSVRLGTESMRMTFLRARDSGALEGIPGLVYALGSRQGVAEQLVDTGIQRLVGDLDELPDTVLGYQILEPPSSRVTLGSQALPADRVHRCSPIGGLVLTLGCKFVCPYCPIPAYNQRQYRAKSGQRISEEIERLYRQYHIRFCFGADDNFFADQDRTLDIVETLARKVDAGSRPHCKFRWGTEATIHDTLQMKDHLAVASKAGLIALWLGVEDMTGTLVRKGQSVDKTTEAFRLLRANRILPVPMLMHHDAQPLYTPGKPYGLLNQVKLLRKAGALDVHVLMITPAPGSKIYEAAFTSGLAFESVAGRPVELHMFDGNYVVASQHKKPWRKQFNIIVAYLYFFNPLRFLIALVHPKAKILHVDAGAYPATPGSGYQSPPRRRKLRRRISRKMKIHLGDAFLQLFGMFGLARTIRYTFVWGLRLMCGKIVRSTKSPNSQIPMRNIDGGPASHALPGTTTAQCKSLDSQGTASVAS